MAVKRRFEFRQFRPLGRRPAADKAATPADPDELAGRILARDELANLIGLADDLAAWSETLDPASCDTATLADIEALGTRAHDIMRRLRAEDVASS